MYDEKIQSHLTLLQKFAMGLFGELSNAQMNIDEVKGIATVKGTKEGKIFSVVIEQQEENSPDNSNVKFSRKSDYREEIKKLYKTGMKQIEIARRLGISQSLVSKLLNDEY